MLLGTEAKIESGGVARVSGPAVDHCLRVAVNQPYETTLFFPLENCPLFRLKIAHLSHP